MDDQILVGLSCIVTGTYLFLIWRAPGMAATALHSAWSTFAKALPWMSVSILLAGLFEQSLDARWLYRLFGTHSGLRGILLAALLGSLGTGTRWGVYPLAAVMLTARASPASVIAFTTSWMLISIPRTAAEFPFFGVRLTFVRMAVSYLAAVAAGVATLLLARG